MIRVKLFKTKRIDAALPRSPHVSVDVFVVVVHQIGGGVGFEHFRWCPFSGQLQQTAACAVGMGLAVRRVWSLFVVGGRRVLMAMVDVGDDRQRFGLWRFGGRADLRLLHRRGHRDGMEH